MLLNGFCGALDLIARLQRELSLGRLGVKDNLNSVLSEPLYMVPSVDRYLVLQQPCWHIERWWLVEFGMSTRQASVSITSMTRRTRPVWSLGCAGANVQGWMCRVAERSGSLPTSVGGVILPSLLTFTCSFNPSTNTPARIIKARDVVGSNSPD